MIPYGRQSISQEDIDAVTKVLRSDWLTTGPAVDAFERAFEASVDAPYAVACSNGTAALHLALLALEFEKGSAVIVPSNTFVATANTVILSGGEVVFADVDPDSGLMLPEHALAAINRAKDAGLKPVAVMPVHFAGQTGDPARLYQLARQHNMAVIEDACHAAGTQYEVEGLWHKTGECAHADMTCFSFHPVKTMTTAEGGMVTCADAKLAERLRHLRSHGLVRSAEDFQNRDMAFDSSGKVNPWYYEMPEIGLNYRLTDLQCALGISQLERLDGFVEKRAKLVELYRERFRDLSNNVSSLHQTPQCKAGWHLFVALIDFPAIGLERGDLMNALREGGVGTQVHYIPVHRQPFYQQRYGNLDLPGTDRYYARCLSLPLYPEMEETDVEMVCDNLRKLVEG